MSTPENIEAVRVVSRELLQRGRLEADHIDVLIELADGRVSYNEYARWMSMAGIKPVQVIAVDEPRPEPTVMQVTAIDVQRE